MPKLHLTPKAESDLEAIHEHYSLKIGAKRAAVVLLDMIETLEMLRAFAHVGRAGRVPDTRELIFSDYPFLAAYRVKEDKVEILRILHQRAESATHW